MADRPDQPFVVCKNAGCSQPILLLRSIPQRGYESPIWSLADAHPNNFACPLCGHVYGYTGQEVLSRPVHTAQRDQLELIYGLIEFDCTEQGCGSRVLVHGAVPRTNAALTRLENEAKHWVLHCACEHGHAILELPGQYWSSSYESSERLNATGSKLVATES